MLRVGAPHEYFLCIFNLVYFMYNVIKLLSIKSVCPTAIPVFESPPTLSPLYQLIVQSELRLQEDGSVTPPCPHNMTFYSVSRHTQSPRHVSDHIFTVDGN